MSNNPRGHQGSLPVQLRPGKPYQFLQDQAYKPFQIFARPGKPSQDQISSRVYLSGPKNTSQNIELFYHSSEKYEVHGVVATDVAFESELHVL